MSKIKVHLFETCNLFHTHVEIYLEQENESGVTESYSINRWAEPKKKPSSDENEFVTISTRAFNSISFEIDGNMDEIINSWSQERQEYSDAPGELCSNNCADVTAWFLNRYAKVQNPGPCSVPITCNYMACGLFAPSFLQSCTLPGRVMDYTASLLQQHRKKNIPSEIPLINIMSR